MPRPIKFAVRRKLPWRKAFVFLVALPAAHAAADSNANPPVFSTEITTLASPAGPGAMGASLATSPEGTVYLSWIEPQGEDRHALRFATLMKSKSWSAPRTIAQGQDWFTNWADFPALAIGANGHVTAVWYVNNPLEEKEPPSTGHPGHGGDGAHHGPGYKAWLSQSIDNGATWSKPQPLTRESDSVEFVSLLPLADGQVLAAWLDGRGKKAGGKAAQLWSRVIGTNGPDEQVDPSTCDCCQTTLTGFPDGSALLAYRGRTEEETRDIITARFSDGKWQRNLSNSRDRWTIAGCPVNGPQLASHGPRVALTWFTASGGEPRVLHSTSPNAGDLYTMARRVDLGNPVGRVATIALRDGTQLVSWLEGPGSSPSQPAGIYLRRFGTAGSTLPPALLTPAAIERASGFPRLALAKDYDDTPATLVLAYTRASTPSQVETLLITLPDAATLATVDQACDCATTPGQEAGYSIRGHVIVTDPEKSALRLRHPALAGIVREGEHDFKVAPNVLAAIKPGREVQARIEERGDGWWIFDVRLVIPGK